MFCFSISYLVVSLSLKLKSQLKIVATCSPHYRKQNGLEKICTKVSVQTNLDTNAPSGRLVLQFFLAHLSRRFKVTYCDHPPSVVVVRPSSIFKQSPPKPLIGFWPNFTGMILGWSSFEVVQMVLVCISRSQELKTDLLTKNLKNLVRNHWTIFNIILQKCSFGCPLPRLFKPFGFVKKHGRQGGGAYFPYISI